MKPRTSPVRKPGTEKPSGFLLLVVIGILAVLLTVCVGFLSFTRNEQLAVQAQRNKTDTSDVMQSAVDWTVANICKDLMDSSGNMDSGKCLQFTTDPSNTGHWWFRPLEMHLVSAFPPRYPNGYMKDGWGWNPLPAHMTANTEAPWVYLPADYLPGGGVRARYTVQVFDTNSCINLNDWNEDCNPTQCQMAHMMMDAYGNMKLENFRYYRDMGSANVGTFSWFQGGPCPRVPVRFDEAWHCVTHSARYLDWTYFDSWRQVDNVGSYNWVTKNSSWLSLIGPQYACMNAILCSNGLAETMGPVDPQPYNGSQRYAPIDPPDGPTPGYGRGQNMGIGSQFGNNPQSAGQLPWYMSGFVTQAHVDPDTGRSPINVNTCYNSGEVLPMSYYDKWDYRTGTYTMEAVWNVESLRRLIKVNSFYDSTGVQVYLNGADPKTAWRNLPPKDKMKVEQLKLKLAYQYQETLCRYFTGTYQHSVDQRRYGQYGADVSTYAATYGSSVPGACAVTDYSAARFPVSLQQFRKNCHDALIAMSNGTTANTDDGVDFDASGKPSINQGKIDKRVACACYDNLYPGKPPDISDFTGCAAFANGDPIWELYQMQLGRQEDMDDPYNIDDSAIPDTKTNGAAAVNQYPAQTAAPLAVASAMQGNNLYGSWADNPALGAPSHWGFPSVAPFFGVQAGVTFPDPTQEVDLKDSTGNNMTLRNKGRDICNADPKNTDPTGPWTDNYTTLSDSNGKGFVPWRQRCFTPDSFSTELTTTSTTFIVIINAQLVDGQSVAANPANPQLHTDVAWNQWGMVVELAPGTEVAPPVAGVDPASPVGRSGFNNLASTSCWQWYKNEMPRRTKTDQGSKSMLAAGWKDDTVQDDSCPSLISYNWGNGNANNYTTPTGLGFQQMSGGSWNSGGSGPDLENSNSSVMPDWKKATSGSEITTGCDIKQVPPANVPSGRGANVIYNGANQAAKRVIIRALWCLNEGIER